MTARDTIAAAAKASYYDTVNLRWTAAADQVITAIRGMPHDELAELRPDIATEFYILKEQAAKRGHYLLTTLRAHHAAEQEGQP